MKRAAIALGDQFGLSLYNKGRLSALVRGTQVRPQPTWDVLAADVQVEVRSTTGTDRWRS
ncbi:hypothetical protein [Rhodococcus jostii]|uniref:hypothetical protein n=1 Tax=Rhodococcus jostii TaxID=132919 RepID=UPI003645AA90